MEVQGDNRIISRAEWREILGNPVLWVSALGYFVDLFDLVLFGVYRVQSLRALGLNDEEVFSVGTQLQNAQMGGMLVGGFLWGILGDRKGRVRVLFGSIACYSLANLLNAFVTNVDQYAVLRFFSGLGLAGEFGVAVTLVSEALPKRVRGLGSTLIAAVGFLGAMSAAGLSYFVEWRHAYGLGGVLGFGLLFLRFRTHDSSIFIASKSKAKDFGNALSIFLRPELLKKYILCLCVGIPIWYVAGILMNFAPEIGRDLGIRGELLAGTAILLGYAGSTIGDLIAGVLSQWLASRRRAIALFLAIDFALILALYFLMPGAGITEFYLFSFFLGITNGYWALFALVASEQFGTNFRSTVTTSLTNLVRGFSVPMILIFAWLKPEIGAKASASLIGVVTVSVAMLALWKMKETFSDDLDFVE